MCKKNCITTSTLSCFFSMVRYALVNSERKTLYWSTTTGQWHHITICLPRNIFPIHSYTITVWYASLSLSPFFMHYPHKVMDEYRRCRHRSIKFQALTGVMKSASWQEQVFLLYHFFRYLCNSSILSIIPNKETRETVAHYWTRYILYIDSFEFSSSRWRDP